MRFATPIIALTLMFSSNASADSCEFGDQIVPVGESVSILDPYLVAESTKYYVDKGLTIESAVEMANNSNWTVIVLECQSQYQYQPPQSEEKPAAMLKRGKPVLVPVDHQKEFVKRLFKDR